MAGPKDAGCCEGVFIWLACGRSQGLGGLRAGGVLAAFVDGHTAFLPRSLSKETLRALFTRDGGEVVDLAP